MFFVLCAWTGGAELKGGCSKIAKVKNRDRVAIIPLGGLGEIGKNMMAIESGDDIIVIDAGLAFPDAEMPGVDVVIPDMTYLFENRQKVRALLLTHGHEDHTGAIPYLLRDMSIPIFGTPLSLGLVKEKLSEHNLDLPAGSRSYRPGETVEIGCFTAEPFRVNHSIADAVGLIIRTPLGIIVHTGDFKFDHTPVDGQVADFHRLAELGNEGVLVLLADSTNADRPGFTPSEKTVGVALNKIVAHAAGRVIVATFASNVHRIQQVIDTAVQYGRKVAVVGRSIENTVQVALELGYLEVPEGTFVPMEEVRRFPAGRLIILTTGTQGEPMSALSRMATGEHRWVEIVRGDTVIIAASPVPGNESMVYRTVNNLCRLGAEVIHGRESGVHVSGHGAQEDLKLMLNLVRPRYLIPVHGEYRHLTHHAELGMAAGIPEERILIGDNGTVFEITPGGARIAGKVQAGMIMVDGLGVGDVGNIVLRDRRQLAQDGILIVVVAIDKETGAILSGPDIVSRGFVYMRESEPLLEEARGRVAEALAGCEARRVTDWPTLKGAVRESLSQYLYEKIRRRPMILPIIMEVPRGEVPRGA